MSYSGIAIASAANPKKHLRHLVSANDMKNETRISRLSVKPR